MRKMLTTEEMRRLPPLRAVLWLVCDLHRPAPRDAQEEGLPRRDPHAEEGQGPPEGDGVTRTCHQHERPRQWRGRSFVRKSVDGGRPTSGEGPTVPGTTCPPGW